jgi:predicted DNA-binding protein with PD1-like motif
MEYHSASGTPGYVIIRLDKDDMLLESIKKIIVETGIKNGVVISGIGTLSDARIHMITTTGYPYDQTYPEWHDDPIEVCGISGIIADGEPHLHIIFSDKTGTYSGHLEEGCRVLYLCEIVIERLEINLERKTDKNNIRKLTVRNEGNNL